MQEDQILDHTDMDERRAEVRNVIHSIENSSAPEVAWQGLMWLADKLSIPGDKYGRPAILELFGKDVPDEILKDGRIDPKEFLMQFIEPDPNNPNMDFRSIEHIEDFIKKNPNSTFMERVQHVGQQVSNAAENVSIFGGQVLADIVSDPISLLGAPVKAAQTGLRWLKGMGEAEKPLSRLETLRKASETIPKAPAKPVAKTEPTQDLPKEFHDARQKEAKLSLDIDAEEHHQAMTGQKNPEVLQQLTDEWKQAKAQTKAIKAQHLKNLKAEKSKGGDGFLDAGDMKKSDSEPLSQADQTVKQSDTSPQEGLLKAFSEQEAKVGKEIRARIEAKKKAPVKPTDYEKEAFDPKAQPNIRQPKDLVDPVSTAKAVDPLTPTTISTVKNIVKDPKPTADAVNLLELDNRSLGQQLEARQQASRKAISIDTTVEQATEEIKDKLTDAYFGQTLKERMIIEPNASVNPNELWKQTRLMEMQGSRFMDMLEESKKAYRQGTITLDQAQRTMREMLITKHIETSTSNLKGTSGRTQRNIRAIKEGKTFKLKDGTEYTPLAGKELNQVLAEAQEGLNRAGLDEMDFMKAVVSIDDAKYQNRLMKSFHTLVTKSNKPAEALYQQMIAQMMFDPSTHAMNIGSGFLAGAYNGAMYTMGALKHELLRPISKRPIGEARLSDVNRFWSESMAAIPKALTAFGQLSRGKQEIIQDLMVREARAIKFGGDDAILRTKVDSAIADNPLLVTGDPKLMFRGGMWKAGWNRLVNLSTVSLRALGNADVALRHIAGMGEMRFRASVKARAIADTKGWT